MDVRPKKHLSLKQRKLVFQSDPKDHHPPNNQQESSCVNKPLEPDPATGQPQEVVLNCDESHDTLAPNHDSSRTTKALPDGLPCLPFSGLCNLGNTCYVNSVLQVLRFCPGFCLRVLEMQGMLEKRSSVSSEDQETGEDTLSSSLYKLWQRMARKEKIVSMPTNKTNTLSPTKPDSFMAKLRQENELFDNKFQHDAQELLRFLLTNLHELYTSLTPPPSPTTPISTHSLTNGTNVCTSSTPSQTGGTVMDMSTAKKRKLSSSSLDKFSHPCPKSMKLNSGRIPGPQKKQKRLDSFFQPSISHHKTTSKESCVDFNFISKTFQGSLAYQTHCFECENTTRRSESFLDISVPVSHSGLPGFPSLSSPAKQSMFGSSVVGPYSLSWCLSQFALREKLRGDNKYHCDECGRFTEAERSLLFGELPAVMTVHLNRFTTQAWGQSADITVSKIGGNVAVPFALSFKPWTTEDCENRDSIYQLFAVVFHSGSSCVSGHYTTCVRMRECVGVAHVPSSLKDGKLALDRNSWLYFDDESVELVSQNELISFLSPLSDNVSTAYILFYTM